LEREIRVEEARKRVPTEEESPREEPHSPLRSPERGTLGEEAAVRLSAGRER
jgi:hypothetical protein